MARGDRLGFADYLKAAFHYRYPVPGLGRLPVNKMALAAFGVLGIANLGFLFLGAAAEAAYLLILSGSPRFQKMIQGERLLATKQVRQSQLQTHLERLTPASRERYGRLLEQCRAVLGISKALDGDSLTSFQSMRTDSLNQLANIFLRLLTSREVLIQNLSLVRPEELTTEVQKVEKQLAEAAEGSPLRRSLQGTLEIQRKRLENFERAQANLLVIDAELSRIEQQVVLIREEAAVGTKAKVLSDRLESVSGTLSETNRWMEQHADIFGDLGPAALEAAPMDLAEIPPVPISEGSDGG